MEVKHPRCRKCKYQADTGGPHNCDYLWYTGSTRSGQVKDPKELDPERCPFFSPGKRLPPDRTYWFEGGRPDNETV